MAGILKVDRVQSDSNLAFQVGASNVAYMNSTGLNLTGGQIIGNGNIYRESNGLLYANNGISFPSAQAASSDPNTLDDYEEGTWTPTFIGTTTNPSSVTYHSNNGGRYIKIGKMVFAQFYFRVNSYSGGSGYAGLSGLPFALATSTPQLYGMGSVQEYQGSITFSTGTTQMNVECAGPGATFAYIITGGNGYSGTSLSIGAFNTGGFYILGSLLYESPT